jgi:ABC-type Na+ efflux pump permease subunit
LSDDRLMRILVTVAILPFVSVAVLPLSRSRYPWARWARWGTIAIFSLAVAYALILSLRWALDRGYLAK